MAGPSNVIPRVREYKSFKLTNFKMIDESEGQFSATANAYGVLDSYNEIVDPGMFKRSLEQQGPERPVLWQHDPSQPVGLGDHSETPNSLEVIGQLALGSTWADNCYVLLKKKVIKRMSIGYDVYKDYFDESGVRHLQEGRLWESSFVTFAANDMALVDAVKAYGYGRHDLPLILSDLTALRGEVKAGRVLSQTNFDRIAQAASILQELLDSVQAAEDSGKSHSPDVPTKQDSQPAEQLSDSDLRSLMEVADVIRKESQAIRSN